MQNIAFGAQEAIALKTFQNGLASYTQSNCQVTLTNDGYRIYRPPNLTVANDGRTMWGGFVLRYPTPPFTKGHTYIISFQIKGKTSGRVSDIGWSNNCGWGGGGLTPSPTGVEVINRPELEWQSDVWQDFHYIWTINDDIYKTCTTAYSNFTQGTVYPSYRDFKFGFDYIDTGTMGTDLYINNVRMYDITNFQNISITKKGQILIGGILEENITSANFKRNYDIGCQHFYEY